MNFGSPGVTGSACGNAACAAADLRDRRRHPLPGLHHRLAGRVFANPERKLVSINVHGYDALKHGAIGVVGDAKVTLEKIDAALGDRASPRPTPSPAPTGTRPSRGSPPRRRRTPTRCPPTRR